MEQNQALVDAELAMNKRLMELKEIDSLTHCIEKLTNLAEAMHGSTYGMDTVIVVMQDRIKELVTING